MTKYCFLSKITSERSCSESCMAYTKEGKTNCRLLNAVEKLVPTPTRPVPPPAPVVKP